MNKKFKARIRFNPAFNNGKKWLTVDAWPTACPGIILTPTLCHDGVVLDKFTLTHRGTGLSLANWMTRKGALRIAQKFAATGFRFTTKTVAEHLRLWKKAPAKVRAAVEKVRNAVLMEAR